MKNDCFILDDDGVTAGILVHLPEDFFIFVSFNDEYPIESVFRHIQTEYGLDSFSLAIAFHVQTFTFSYGDNGSDEEF